MSRRYKNLRQFIKKRPAEETGQDELNQYLVDIYKMYESHQTDDAMYRVMQAYTTIGIEKIHSTNKRYMREYEQHLNEKARMDMRVGRKPKNYHKVVGLVQKYKKEYTFIRRTQPIVEKILKERQQIEMGTDPIKDLEKGTINIGNHPCVADAKISRIDRLTVTLLDNYGRPIDMNTSGGRYSPEAFSILLCITEKK